VSALIKLDRVEFRDAINAPGRLIDQYPTRETVLVCKETPNHRLASKQHFNLWLDEARGVVVVQHPASEGPPEYVPLSNVLAWREAPAEKQLAKK
jgi:hypothetical protein